MKNTFIFYQILSCNSLTKSMENWYEGVTLQGLKGSLKSKVSQIQGHSCMYMYMHMHWKILINTKQADTRGQI